jgi:hypothetical protein
MASIETAARKATMVPLQYCSWELRLEKPFLIQDSATIEDVRQLLKPEDFALWKDYISSHDRKNLASAHFGLVHRFASGAAVGREEEESKEFLHNLFVCLRVIRPTRSVYSAVQYKLVSQSTVDVVRFMRSDQSLINVPEGQTLSYFVLDDFFALRRLLPAFQNLMTHPSRMQRAVNLYEGGFSDVREPSLQMIVWVMGIETALSRENEDEILPQNALIGRLAKVLNLNQPLYEQVEGQEIPIESRLALGDLLPDVFKLRNRIVHGQWIPDEWRERIGFVSEPTKINVLYSETLRHAASYILRRLILSHLERHSSSAISSANQ